MQEKIKKLINKAIAKLGEGVEFSVDFSDNPSHGDYSSNVALVLAKKLGKNPRETAELIKEKIGKNKLLEKIEIAGPGFINFFIAKEFFREKVEDVCKRLEKAKKPAFAEASAWRGIKIILDYTDPNPFKEFHIGHLMTNAIGESLSRIFEFEGAKVKRVCYQGDVGMHVAKAMWGIFQNKENFPKEADEEEIKIKFLSSAYALGSQKYEEDEVVKKEVAELNKKIFERTDKEINHYYDFGKRWSLEHFDNIYKKLSTRFDWLIFESEVGAPGKKIVEEGLKKGVFENGENGAIIFKGEKFGLHTRVFVNSMGLPTYEAKDFGLAKLKFNKFPYDKSVIVTGNEVNEYFKVMLCAMEQLMPGLAKKTTHIGHGMLRLPEGKMSSRTGKVISGESLLDKLQDMVFEKIKDRELSDGEKNSIAEKVAVGSFRYSVLKQSIGSDIVFDFNKSISFEGDSGPYLQYSCTRAISVLEKAKAEKIKPSFKKTPEELSQFEKKMAYFPEIVEKAGKNLEPHFLVLYLTELAGEFNSYYAKNRIVDKGDQFSPYKVALAQSFVQIMKNGMWLLGIEALNKM